MAYFAELDADRIVQRVIRVSNDDAPDPVPAPSEQAGRDFIRDTLGLPGEWRQTSYNTHGGQHANGGTPFRFNYAGIGYTFSDAPEWDAQGGAFIPPMPEDGEWVLDLETALWVEVTA